MKNVFLGLIAGVAIGLLLAPDEGTQTRRKLAKRFDDFMNSLTDRWEGRCVSDQAGLQN